MKIFLLLLYLIANSYCLIKKVDYNSLTPLNTTNTTNTSSYFYMETKVFRDSVFIYLYFEDKNYNLNKSNLKYCFTNISPDEEVSCSFDNVDGPFATINRDKMILYFYKISYRNDGYLIIGYDGTNPNGSLSVQCASDNLYDLVKDVADFALSALVITWIVIGSCVGLVCLLVIILNCIFYVKKAITAETIEKTQPQPTEEDKNPMLYPLDPEQPVNSEDPTDI